jgi:branched-chain amino acid aminotransferase
MIFLNGQFCLPEAAAIHPADRGFLLGDGIFETLRVNHGQVRHLTEHWRRFTMSAAYLEIPVPFTQQDLTIIIRQLLEKNSLSDEAVVRLTLTRGAGPRGLGLPMTANPTWMAAAFPFTPPPQTVSAWVVGIRRNELSPLAQIKSLNYLENILARREAVKAGADEAILLNSKHHVAEAAAANIFLVTAQGQLTTPPLADGALPGVTRQTVINLAAGLHLDVAEKSITVDDLDNAAEVFLTNSLITIQPVISINNNPIHNRKIGPITLKLQAAALAAG